MAVCREVLAGIRIIDGMKTRNDGPDYTTRAVFAPLAPCS